MAIDEFNTNEVENAQSIAALVSKSLPMPTMGHGGGSATEERMQDRWRSECIAELWKLRAIYQPPEVHRILDAIALNLRA